VRNGRVRFATAAVLGSMIELVACADPAAEQARKVLEADKINLFGDAAAYYTCSHQAVIVAGECERYWQIYRHDRELFVAKYGAGSDQH
jgi:hypothetical protein